MQSLSQVENVIDTLSSGTNTFKYITNQGKHKQFITFSEYKQYIPIIGCVLNHIITNNCLSNFEKLYYILINSLAFVNSKTGKKSSVQRSFSLSAEVWARLLNCSRSQIFSLQKSLKAKGYLIIINDQNKYRQNKRNLLIPTLPDEIFKFLCETSTIVGKKQLEYDSNSESKLEYLDKTKLFIPLNYNLLKIVTSDKKLSPLQKVIWLDFYAGCYKNYVSKNKLSFAFSLTVTYTELMERYRCSKSSLSKIMNGLENNHFIAKARFFCKKDYAIAIEDRQDKSLWQILLCIPASYNLQSTHMKERSANLNPSFLDMNAIPNELTNTSIISLAKVNRNITSEILSQNKVSYTDPHISKSELHINKNFISKNSKSNFREAKKFFFNDSLQKLKNSTIKKNYREKTPTQFNICNSLIQNKLKELSKDKINKAKRFAYSLISKKLAKGYAATISKHDLARQIIHHAATWKPTKLGNLSREQEIDIAISVAWKYIIKGTWQPPRELAKAEILDYEYQYYYRKYWESGIISHEVKFLESIVNNLLRSNYNLERKITETAKSMISNNQSILTYDNKEIDNSASENSHIISVNNHNNIEENYDMVGSSESLNQYTKIEKNNIDYRCNIHEAASMDPVKISSSIENILKNMKICS